MQIFKKFFRERFGFSHREIKGSIVLIFGLFLIIGYETTRNFFFSKNHDKKTAKEKQLSQEFAIVKNEIPNGDTQQEITKNKVKTNRFQSHKKSKAPNDAYSNTIVKVDSPSKITVDINRVSANELEVEFGFSNILAKRIIKFRDALGGFVNLSQLLEVYGIDKNKCKKQLERFYLSKNFQVQQISINSASVKELVKHPYISYAAAIEIVRLREKQKNKINFNDLHHIDSLKETLEKAKEYLIV